MCRGFIQHCPHWMVIREKQRVRDRTGETMGCETEPSQLIISRSPADEAPEPCPATSPLGRPVHGWAPLHALYWSAIAPNRRSLARGNPLHAELLGNSPEAQPSRDGVV